MGDGHAARRLAAKPYASAFCEDRCVLAASRPKRGLVVGLVERFIAADYARVRQTHAKLAELSKQKDATVFSAHDPTEFDRLRAASLARFANGHSPAPAVALGAYYE
jgi:hypothetical protein